MATRPGCPPLRALRRNLSNPCSYVAPRAITCLFVFQCVSRVCGLFYAGEPAYAVLQRAPPPLSRGVESSKGCTTEDALGPLRDGLALSTNTGQGNKAYRKSARDTHLRRHTKKREDSNRKAVRQASCMCHTVF